MPHRYEKANIILLAFKEVQTVNAKRFLHTLIDGHSRLSSYPYAGKSGWILEKRNLASF